MRHRLSGRRRPSRSTFRPQFERLEPRECLAVSAIFSTGVLTVVGDGGGNVVEVLDSGDGQVTVVGDGQTFEFSGVDEILVQTLGGNDQVFYQPKAFQIISAGKNTVLDIDAGADDDLISISDDVARGASQIQSSQFIAKMQLGTGRDRLSVGIEQHDQVDLDVFAADPGDGVAIAMLLPAVQKVREAAARISLDLGGVGDLVNVTTVNYDDVEVALTTGARTGPAPNAHDLERVSFVFHQIEFAQNRAAQFDGRLAVRTSLGDADDLVSIVSTGFADVSTNLATAGGDDQTEIRHRMFAIVDRSNLSVNVDLGAGDNTLRARLEDYTHAETTVASGAGDDFVQIDHQQSSKQGWGKWEVSANVLAGDDCVLVNSLGYDRGTLQADLGDGNDALQLLAFRQSTADDAALPEPVLLEVQATLGSGDDSAHLVSRGFRQITTDVDTGPPGEGRDRLLATHIAGDFSPSLRRRNLVTTLSLDRGRVRVISIGYESVEVRTEQTRQITIIQDL